MDYCYYTYPEKVTSEIFYIGFYKRHDKTTWQLFRRQFFEDQKLVAKNSLEELCNEVHPWNLGEGIVNNEIISMNSEGFLKFWVDALNMKHERDELNKIIATLTPNSLESAQSPKH